MTPACTHPELRTFTFSTGETIEMCPEVSTFVFPESKKQIEIKLPCTHGDKARSEILGRKQ